MTVQELINKLLDMPPDLHVYAYTDHGQTPERIMSPSVQYFSEDLESFTDDEEEAEDSGYEIKGMVL